MTPVESLKVGVAIPGAGRGERMGGVRKPFLEINGEPVLVHALRPFLADPRVVAIVVAVAHDDASRRRNGSPRSIHVSGLWLVERVAPNPSRWRLGPSRPISM